MSEHTSNGEFDMNAMAELSESEDLFFEDGVRCHPLNFDALKKGQVLEASQLEEILRVSHTSTPKRFRLAMMGLREQIERELAKRNYHVLVRCEGETLRILTDEEAVGYSQASIDRGFRKAVRYHSKQRKIDTEQLSAAQKKMLERNVIASGRKLMAAANEAKKIRMENAAEEMRQRTLAAAQHGSAGSHS